MSGERETWSDDRLTLADFESIGMVPSGVAEIVCLLASYRLLNDDAGELLAESRACFSAQGRPAQS